MRVLVSGSSGFIGRALVPALTGAGHQVTRLVRRPAGPGELAWDVPSRRIDGALDGIEAVVHLAGAGIGERRWTEQVKADLVDSRIDGTRLLCGALADLPTPPAVMVSGSAVGYYGDRGAEILEESSPAGTGFLAELCVGWEAATAEAEQAGVRVVHLRTGIVLGAGGGVLAKSLPLARLGLGGRLGAGRQYMSWVGMDDEVGAILHALDHASLSGPLNAVSPNPVTNAAFTRALASVLRRPAPLPVPAFALAAALGSEMTSELVLASQRAQPTRLVGSGYSFSHPDLVGAVMAATGRAATGR